MVRPRIVAQDYHAPEASPPLAHAFLMHLQRPALRLGEVVVVEARMILVALLLIAVAITVRVEVAKGAVYDTNEEVSGRRAESQVEELKRWNVVWY